MLEGILILCKLLRNSDSLIKVMIYCESLNFVQSEDEEGYRKLIDEKKDKRLAHLLQQTDEFIKDMTDMVRKHQEELRDARLKKKKK